MKEWMKKLLKKKEEQRAAMKQKGDSSDNVAEVRSILNQVQDLDAEIAELRQQIDALPDEPVAGGNTPPAETRSAQSPQVPQAGSNTQNGQVLASYGMPVSQRQEQPADPYSTIEYRTAFMDFVKTGKITPALQLRDDQMTTTADVSAVVPTTILNEIVKEMKVYGQVFRRVRKMNIQGGVEVPILSLKPVAYWIGETPTSDKQKVQANTKVTFSYYGLECKVSISLLANTVTLTGFESTIVELIVEAMAKAIDEAVVKGNGTGKPKGITMDSRVPNGQIVTMTADEFSSYDGWAKKVFAKLPLAHKSGAVFLMASGTFEGYINGMVDANGQPIGRINYGITDGPQERFGGREVILVEDDIIAPYESASNGDVVAIFCNLKNYGFNSNMEMRMFRYFDHDTNEWVDKAILIADGKLIDPYGVVIVKKGA